MRHTSTVRARTGAGFPILVALVIAASGVAGCVSAGGSPSGESSYGSPPKPFRPEPGPELRTACSTAPATCRAAAEQLADAWTEDSRAEGALKTYSAACQAGDGPSCEAIDRRFTSPKLLRTHDLAPGYTREAFRKRLQGTWVATCRLGRDGRVGECRVATPTPELDPAFLGWLRDAPFSPVTLDGRPFALDHRFEFSLVLGTP